MLPSSRLSLIEVQPLLGIVFWGLYRKTFVTSRTIGTKKEVLDADLLFADSIHIHESNIKKKISNLSSHWLLGVLMYCCAGGLVCTLGHAGPQIFRGPAKNPRTPMPGGAGRSVFLGPPITSPFQGPSRCTMCFPRYQQCSLRLRWCFSHHT